MTPYEAQVADSKQLRVELDSCLQKLKQACGESNNPPFPVEGQRKSRERSIAITKLQESIMWLGMDLKSLGETNPYPNSYNPTNSIVDMTVQGLKL